MTPIYISTFLIFSFGILNLLGIKSDLVVSQLMFFGQGLILFFIVKKAGRNFFIINSKFFYWLFIFFLVVVLFLAKDVRGSRRWINFAFINFQPSEFFKIFFVLFFSEILAKTKSTINQRKKFFTLLAYFILPAFLIFKQPDLGTTLVLTAIFFAMTFISNIPKKYFLKLVVALLALFPIGWLVIQPYQQERLISFISPHLDKGGTSYNMIQSIITIGDGGFFGRGLGFGTQSRLFFLPENFTDFAYASFIEQFGFFGGVVLIGLFIVLFYSLMKKIFKYGSFDSQQTAFNFYYVLGIFIMIFCQVVINMGMNMGILPITGITLPLISYGGSSLVSLMLGLALLP